MNASYEEPSSPSKTVHKKASIPKEGAPEEITGHEQSWPWVTPPPTLQKNKLGNKSMTETETNLKL